jgi:hypothetical protein
MIKDVLWKNSLRQSKIRLSVPKPRARTPCYLVFIVYAAVSLLVCAWAKHKIGHIPLHTGLIDHLAPPVSCRGHCPVLHVTGHGGSSLARSCAREPRRRAAGDGDRDCKRREKLLQGEAEFMTDMPSAV